MGGIEFRIEGAEGFDDATEPDFTDGGVATTDFHGAGDAELLAHGRDGDAAFFEKGTEMGISRRGRKGQRVAFAALHGELETELLGEIEGVNSAREDGSLGGNFFSGVGHDSFVIDQRFYLGVDDFSAVFFDSAAEGFEEIVRIEVAVLGEPHAALGLDVGIGFEFMQAGGVTDFGLESETMRCFGDFGFFVEAFLRLAEHEETFLDERKIFFCREFDVELSAGEGKIAEEGLAIADVLLVGVAHEEPDPAGESGVESGTEKEWALRVEHPFEALGNDAGRGERNEVAGDNHACVFAGA